MIGSMRNVGREEKSLSPHKSLIAGLSAFITMTIFTLVVASHT